MNALSMLDEITHYGLLKTLEKNLGLLQRDLAKKLSVSLGEINFCLNALVEKGSLKISNFRNSDNKLAYAYLLTPREVEEKARIREVVDALHEKGATEHIYHTKVNRPWGSYTVLEEDPEEFKLKSIEVAPGARLSLQSHKLHEAKLSDAKDVVVWEQIPLSESSFIATT
jgi:EPS-associated MarR family transcriptional regulator